MFSIEPVRCIGVSAVRPPEVREGSFEAGRLLNAAKRLKPLSREADNGHPECAASQVRFLRI
jgi:hypothetical protein